MSDSYCKLLYHIVFSTKYRAPLITPALRAPLYGFLGSVLERRNGVLLAIGGMPDHVHILAGWKPTLSVSEMLRTIKATSSKWVHELGDTRPEGFVWQTGYGAFSVSESAVPGVRAYIENQEAHHRKMTSAEEFAQLLRRHGIPFDPGAISGEDRREASGVGSPGVSTPGASSPGVSTPG